MKIVNRNRIGFCQSYCHIVKGYTFFYKSLFRKHSKSFWKKMTFRIEKEMEKENETE